MLLQNLYSNQPHLIKLCFIAFLTTIFFNYIIIKIWSLINTSHFSKDTNFHNIQQIHLGNIPRLGGLAIVLSLVFITIITNKYIDDHILKNILIFGIPFFLITFIEDLYQNISPILRLILLFFCSFIFLHYSLDSLPQIQIILISDFINIPIVSAIFFTIGLTAYMNGVNFLDGTNGLAGFTILSSLASLLFVALIFKDYENAVLIIIFIFVLSGFMFFNYPNGSIFLGDLGAYFLGWFTGIMTINIMGNNQEIPNWCALIILSYPIIEVSFSFIRKSVNLNNPFYPDKKHLHLKLFFFLKNKHKIKPISAANALVAPLLAIQWMTPIVLIPWIYSNGILIFLAILLQIIIYLIFYFSVNPEA